MEMMRDEFDLIAGPGNANRVFLILLRIIRNLTAELRWHARTHRHAFSVRKTNVDSKFEISD